MKTFLTLLCFVFFLFSCEKNNIITQPVNTSKLMSITSADPNDDSSANYFFYYAGNRVTDIYWKSRSTNDSFHLAHFDYVDDNYIKVTMPTDELLYTEYYLNNFKLPVTIIKHSGSLEPETLNFSYKQGTNLLDSVNDSRIAGYYSMHYAFNYQEDNISDILITQPFSGGSGNYSLHYTYDLSTPNIFKHTDSLLFIYTDPFASQISTTYIPHNFFANLFSASTFETISFIGDPFNYSDTLNYTLDIDDKISSLGYNGYSRFIYSY
jgi:hypothetical protein